MTEAIIALLAAIFGGAGLKIIEHIMNNSTRKSDLAKDIRDELRIDLKSAREEITRLREERDHLRHERNTLDGKHQVLLNYLRLGVAIMDELADACVDAQQELLASARRWVKDVSGYDTED